MMIQRLLEFMRIKNLTSSQLADAIGVQRSGISHFVSGRNKPSLEFILKILHHFPEVSPDWLLLGKEPMFRGDASSLPFHAPESTTQEDIGVNVSDGSVDFQPSLLDELFNEPPGQELSEDIQEAPGSRPKPESHPQTQAELKIETLTGPSTESHPQILAEVKNEPFAGSSTESHPQTQEDIKNEPLIRPSTESHPQNARKFPEIPENKEVEKENLSLEKPVDVEAERIVIFYSDRTFREYLPS